MKQRQVVLLAAVLFFSSGFAALIDQVIWQRILGIFSGLHIYSVTLIVTAFMAGLGFGSLLGGRFADRLGAEVSILAFAICELAIGVFALASPWLYYDVAYLRLGFLVRYPLALPFAHFLMLVVPTFLMGASLPLLARGLVTRASTAASTIGILYGVNTLGAAVGAGVSSWILISAFGFAGTLRIGAALNFLAAAGAVWIWRVGFHDSASTPASSPALDPQPPSASALGAVSLPVWCVVYGFSGFVALSLELLWFRMLDVTIQSSPYTFGHLLGVFLGFLALGSLVGSRYVSRWQRPELVFLWGQWGITATAGVALLFLVRAPLQPFGLAGLETYWSQYAGIEISGVLQALNSPSDPESRRLLVRVAQIYLGLPVFLIAIPTFLMGLTFTSIQRIVQTDVREVGWRVGAVQTSNIVGSILGSLITGTLFLEYLGTARTAMLLLCTGLVFAGLMFWRLRGNQQRPAAAIAAVVSLILALSVPPADAFWARFHGSPLSHIDVAEDASGVASVHRFARGAAMVRVNGKGHSMMPFGDEHTLLGILPALLHPGIEDALVIGLGSGNTAWALGAAPELSRMDLYEIVRTEVDVLRRFAAQSGYRPLVQLLDDPRVRWKLTDGRLALRTEPTLYDLVEADPLEPSMSFSGNMFSKEFFELCRSRLKPGGYTVIYVPTERTRRTAARVFPHLIELNTQDFAAFLIAANEPVEFDRERIRQRLHGPAVQAYLRQAGEQVHTTEIVERFLDQASVRPIDDSNRERYTEGDFNSDLFPRDEFDKRYTGTYQ